MDLYGVVNCSPDSLNEDSIVRDGDSAADRIRRLLAEGATGVDIGGQGSTRVAKVAEWQVEWDRVRPAIEAATGLCDDISIDTYRTEVAYRALEAGANVLNAANGMGDEKFWVLAAEHDAQVVLPFLNGPDPFHLEHVVGDPIEAMIDYFTERLRLADKYGMRDRCLLDPGTGFGPHDWEWADRFEYQKVVYSGLHRLRVLGLPLYIPLPWRDTPDHALLLDIVVRQRPEYGRAHYPAVIRAAEAAAGL